MEWSCCFVTARPLRVVCLYCMLVCLAIHVVIGQIGVDNFAYTVTARVGERVTLVCDLNNVNSDIYWHTYENSDISRNQYILVESFRDRYSIVGNQTQGEYNLNIENVHIADAKIYNCVVYTGLTRLSRDVLVTTELVVTVPPSEDSPKCDASPTVGISYDFSVGDKVRLKCTTIGGSPIPRLVWYDLDDVQLASGAGTLQEVVTLDQYDASFKCVMTTPALNEPQTCVLIPLKSPRTTPLRYKKPLTLPPSSKTNDPQVTTQVKHTGLSGRTQTAIDDKDPVMQNIILIGAAGGGGFLLLVLLVSIIIAIICCWRKKRTKGVVSTPANRPATGEYEMVNPQPESSNQSKTVISKENSYVTVDSPSKDPGGQSPDGESPVYAQPGTKDDRKNAGAGGLVYADLDLNDASDDIIQTDEPTEYAKIKV